MKLCFLLVIGKNKMFQFHSRFRLQSKSKSVPRVRRPLNAKYFVRNVKSHLRQHVLVGLKIHYMLKKKYAKKARNSHNFYTPLYAILTSISFSKTISTLELSSCSLVMLIFSVVRATPSWSSVISISY